MANFLNGQSYAYERHPYKPQTCPECGSHEGYPVWQSLHHVCDVCGTHFIPNPEGTWSNDQESREVHV